MSVFAGLAVAVITGLLLAVLMVLVEWSDGV